MNWSRIKSIFIIAFLILNLFLGYQLWDKHTKKIEEVQIYENKIEDLLQLRNITLEAELRGEQMHMPQLNVQFLLHSLGDIAQLEGQHLLFEERQLISRLATFYQLPDPWNEDVFKEQFVEEYVLKGEQYQFDHFSEQGIIYLQHIESFPVFGGTLEIVMNNEQQVVGYAQIYYDLINRGTNQSIISSFTSVRSLIDNDIIPENSIIKKVTLGYFGQVYEVESQILTPVWRVMIEHDHLLQHIYVHGITGTIITAPM